MPQVLPINDLRSVLKATYSRETLRKSKELRKINIEKFFIIDRNGLEYALKECRTQMYSTLLGEKIYIQYPGKESSKNYRNPMPKDFRPKLQCADGSMMKDATFGFIWDILDEIGKQHREYLSLVAAVFFRMGYMYNYVLASDLWECSTLYMDNHGINKIENNQLLNLSWYQIDFSDDVWHSLNNYIGSISTADNQVISFEAFIKFVDLLLQNEDCKYYFKNIIQGENLKYNLKSGRTSTCDANLLVIE